MRNILLNGAQRLSISLDEAAIDAFCLYGELLKEKNSVMNLTAITGEKEVAELHFLDCLALLTVDAFHGKSVIDIGCGAGFPGLPIKIAEPSIKLTLIDAQQKKVGFLAELCAKLHLSETQCMHARAEEAALLRDMRDSFDFAVSRAVARLYVLAEICLPYVRLGGAFIAMKGTESDAEIKEAEKAFVTLGAMLEKITDYEIPGTHIVHRAVIIRKISPTPVGYPRRFTKIQKCPI